MMSQFAVIYDIITVGLLVGMLFAGLRKGFASAVVSLAAVAVAFICAMAVSEPVSNAVYSSFVEQPIEQAVSSAIDETVGAVTLAPLSGADYSAVRVNGVSVEDMQPDFGEQNRVTLDLSDVDLSGTGITAAQLSAYGIPADADVSSVSGKTAKFTKTDVERYGLGKMIVAQVIAVNIENSDFFGDIAEFAKQVGDAVPLFFGGMAEEIADGSASALRSVVLIMQSGSSSFKEAVINGIIEPCVKIFVQTIVFVVIFIIVAVALGIASKLLKFVNKIPLIGGLNALCGGLIGIVQGVIAVFVVCIAVRLITVLSGGTIMFFNSADIQSTFIFKVFYNFEFLNFIN